jgi:hypothetical protein
MHALPISNVRQFNASPPQHATLIFAISLSLQTDIPAGLGRSNALLHKLLIPFLGVVALVYVAQINSPVRLNTDAIVYLNSSHTATTGQGYMYTGREIKYPKGYPFLVSSLERIGLANSYSLMMINLVFLALGLWMTYRISRRTLQLSETESVVVLVFSLLSYVVVKNSALPMSDTVAFGLSMMSLCATVTSQRRSGRKAGIWLGIAVIFALAAINTRTIYVTLFPAIAAAAFHVLSKKIEIPARWSRRVFWLSILVSMIITLLLINVVLASQQFLTIERIYRESGVVFMLGQVIYGTSLEWGQILLNVPLHRLFGLGASEYAVQLSVGLLGVLTIAGFFVVLWNRRSKFGPLEIYFLAYVGMLVIWPSRDPRLWFGLIPLLIAYALPLFKSLLTVRFARQLVLIYLTIFVLIGVGALRHNTWISYSGSNFPATYGDGTMSKVYEALYNGTALPEAAGNTEINSMVRVLRAYEARVHENYINDSTYDIPVPLRPRKSEL